MRRMMGAGVVMALIGVWNLAGQWFFRVGDAPEPVMVTAAARDSIPLPISRPTASMPAPRRSRHPAPLPVSFRSDPLVFLSTAPAESLDLLPGVGPVLASRIIEARRARGPFASWDDVLAVKGIGPRTVERWQSIRQ
jgi:hypothetical protein